MNRTKNNLLKSFLDLLFPPNCFSCRKRIPEGIICEECKNDLVWLEDVCNYCGSILKNGECKVCSKEDFAFDRARSVYGFNKVMQKFIHDLKYDEMIRIADFLGQKAAELLLELKPFSKIDIIAPVPLHSVKKRHRGFNQAEMLARKIASELKIEHNPNLIIRKRFTQTQTKLGRSERQQNVKGAFELNSKYEIKGKTVLVVDDVFTTGSTLNSISLLLKKHKVSQVFAFTLARA
ncbi:MAG: ComF family protein [Candidatus Cloacimonetes bacterium]|nr:ComF family protein [Candidatus Cloacimonadota bacterium]MCF7815386.1 ComF family protein [Candidatus Cloacimonadota bacterium]MCF7869473.1 ComF family protein [Candidatus Cloacimonadota bacterium]MCF7884838.1 ComF family protein [Candidatus Cloacimonadota bacterium]